MAFKNDYCISYSNRHLSFPLEDIHFLEWYIKHNKIKVCEGGRSITINEAIISMVHSFVNDVIMPEKSNKKTEMIKDGKQSESESLHRLLHPVLDDCSDDGLFRLSEAERIK